MNKLKGIICIIFIVLCIQITYARFFTKEPNGNVSGKIGQAIVDIEQGKIDYNEYEEDKNGAKIPSLYVADDTITNQIFVKNYNENNEISDVDLKSNIYVVLYKDNNTVINNLDCILKDENNNEISGEVLTNKYELNVNGVNKTLPVGTIKFPTQDILKAGEMTKKGYKLEISLHDSALPTTKMMSNMKIYCQAEQNV